MMFKKKINNELPIPQAALDSSKSSEIFRAWVADGSLSVTIRIPDSWNDPAAYGIFIADLINHGKNIYGQKGIDPDDALSSILNGVKAEFPDSTGDIQTQQLDQ